MLSAKGWREIVRRCTHRHIPLCAQECSHDFNRLNKQFRHWSFLQTQKRELDKMKRRERIPLKKVYQVQRLPKYKNFGDEVRNDQHSATKSRMESSYDMEIGPDGIPYDPRQRLNWVHTDEFTRISPEMLKIMEKYEQKPTGDSTQYQQRPRVKFESGLQFIPVGLDRVNPGFASYLRYVMENDKQRNALFDISFYPKPGEPLYLDDENEDNANTPPLKLVDIAALLKMLKRDEMLTSEQLEQLYQFMATICQLSPESMMGILRLLQSYNVLTPKVLTYLRELLLNTGIDIPGDMLNRLFETLLLIDNDVKYVPQYRGNQSDGTNRSAEASRGHSKMSSHGSHNKFKNHKTGSHSKLRPKHGHNSHSDSQHTIHPDLMLLHRSSYISTSKHSIHSDQSRKDSAHQPNCEIPLENDPTLQKPLTMGKIAGYYEPWSYTGPLNNVKQAYRMGVATRLSTLKNSTRNSYDVSSEIQKMREMEAVRKVFPAKFHHKEHDSTRSHHLHIHRNNHHSHKHSHSQSHQMPQFLIN